MGGAKHQTPTSRQIKRVLARSIPPWADVDDQQAVRQRTQRPPIPGDVASACGNRLHQVSLWQ